MTNEEIQRKIVGAVEMFESRSDGMRGTLIGILSACAGSLVLQAYEEAANDAENWGTEDDEPTDPDVAFGCLAAAIRARKGSLVSVESSST